MHLEMFGLNKVEAAIVLQISRNNSLRVVFKNLVCVVQLEAGNVTLPR